MNILKYISVIFSVIVLVLDLNRIMIKRFFYKLGIMYVDLLSKVVVINETDKNTMKKYLKKNSSCEQNSIVNELLEKKNKQYFCATRLILLYILFYSSIGYAINIEINTIEIIFLFIIVVFIFSNQWLVNYRINKGYYGTNYEEAKELLYYLIENNDKNNKNTGKKILNDEYNYNKEKVTVPVTDREVQY